MTPDSYSTFDVSVPDGTLRVGRWGHGERVVIAAHGTTGNHREFRAVAERLGDDVTFLAPDLRGRGGSNGITGPFGLGPHADDIAAILDHVHVDSATVAGHSLGGFVALVVAQRHPDRVRNLVLIDGGLPPPIDLGPLAELPIEEVVRKIIGPSLDRLRMTFDSLETYFDFWRPHPALQGDWNKYVEDYLRYDLIGEPPQLRSGASEDAVLADSESGLNPALMEEAIASLKHPVVFVRAPRGVFNQEPPLYPQETIERFRVLIPQMRDLTVPDVNHFTLTLSERGAKAVAEVISEELDRSPDE